MVSFFSLALYYCTLAPRLIKFLMCLVFVSLLIFWYSMRVMRYCSYISWQTFLALPYPIFSYKVAIWSDFTAASIRSMQWTKFDVYFIKDVSVVETNLISFFLMKYIIFVKIINNVTDVIVPSFTWRHHGIFTLLWHFFTIIFFSYFQCSWQCFFYMGCRVINRSLLLCYC